MIPPFHVVPKENTRSKRFSHIITMALVGLGGTVPRENRGFNCSMYYHFSFFLPETLNVTFGRGATMDTFMGHESWVRVTMLSWLSALCICQCYLLPRPLHYSGYRMDIMSTLQAC